MEIDQLVSTACERAGSDDFGGDSWREGLGVLVRALEEEASLNELGTYAMTEQIVGYLVARLQVEQTYAAHPEIDEQQIVAPLFGIGLPRTGSTALSYLLAQDPARRTLRVWEAGTPVPPPETATEHTDPRIAQAQLGIDATNQMLPDFHSMLPSEAEGPQECLVPMAMEFRSMIFEGMAHIPSYSSWILSTDVTPAYRYHQRVLKLLQWRCPPDRWWLKAPAHICTIDALDEVYPDARFVMTHRDVGKVITSVSALYATLGGILTTDLDPIAIGAHSRKTWRLGLERLIAFRDRGNEHRFFDLGFAEVQSDPIAAVTKLYAELGDELSDVARDRMEAWWAKQQSERTGAGTYPPETYGLDLDEIADEFSFYTKRFL